MTQQATAGETPLDKNIPHQEMTPEEVAEAFPDGTGGGGEEDEAVVALQKKFDTALADGQEPAPDWAVVPPGLKIPAGKKVTHVMFRAAWTDTPQKGDRIAMMWPLNEREEGLAYERATGGGTARSIAELTKASIRVIDGQAVDWTKGKATNVNFFWADIGQKCRQMLQNIYMRSSTFTQEEQLDFFANCIVVTSSVSG